jgi:glutaminyl-peptide cyclotransferase
MKKNGLFLLLALIVLATITQLLITSRAKEPFFDGQRAYQDLVAQVAFGPRVPGSPAHEQAIHYIQTELTKAGWTVSLQVTELQGVAITNIIAERADGPGRIILGAHYDSRILADQDKGPGRSLPVSGANDGASGVAILLELARLLPPDTTPVTLVFFDQEDNGSLDGRQWIVGSTAFVQSLTYKPDCAIIVDMVGDTNLNLPFERDSTPDLVKSIWGTAARLGYTQFINIPGYTMLDDHTPFLRAGIPAVDIIDFDYPYWHTSQDLPDKVSATSLRAVGDTLLHWIIERQ